MALEPKAIDIDLVEPSDGDVTKEWLEKELENAQEKLEKRVNKIEGDSDDGDSDDDYGLEDHKGTPLDQLYELNDTVEALALSQEVTQWASDSSSNNNNNNHNNTADISADDIFHDANDCEALAQILCRHDSQSSLYQNLFEKEYQPLHNYVRHQLTLQLRSLLLQAGYPSAEGCGALFAAVTVSPTPLTQCCECLTRLQVVHHRVTQHTHQTSVSAASTPWASGETCDVMTEFFRPIVERVHFHFVQFSNDRVTSTKVDRLPEWLLTYIQEHVLEGKPAPKAPSTATSGTTTSSSSPWELMTMGLAPYVTESMPILFANELVGLIKYVLSERNYFRDHKIAGPESNPMLLCNAIEQLLAFDEALRNLMPMGQADRLLRLMDIFVAGDEELLSWWLAREKEMVFSTLFDNTSTSPENADSQTKQRNKLAALVKTRISPRAELFCALIRSVQMKASVFSFSGPYLNAVAVPLCMQFLDAVHESATDLRKILAGPLPASSAAAEAFLASNIEDWMSVFNGTRLAAAILTRENPWAQQSMAPSNTSSVNDLARFGRSLEQLQNVLVEEFATTFVESFLMERVKLASYLMRCSHFLSHSMSNEDDDDYYDGDISQDLKPCFIAMSKFLSICKDCELESMEDEGESSFAIEFAPRVMQAKVVPMLADKFLEVAINLQGLTPEVIPEGASIFARDVETLFGKFSPHAETSVRFPLVERLLDVTRLMALPAKSLVTLQSALLGLVGGPEDPSRPWHLENNQFKADATLFEEAVSMLRAKGFMLELEDAISVLNRRRDLMTM